MKIFFCLLLLSGLAACKRPTPPVTPGAEPGASFKEGHGVRFSAEMQKSLGIRILDVTEQKLTPKFEVPLHVVRPTEADGWLTAAQAAVIKPGQQGALKLPDGKTAPVIVERVEKSIDAAMGDFEITVTAAASLAVGSAVIASFEAPATSEVVAVPNSAVMKTAEGEFVYAVNEEHFKRVPVQTGARSADAIEITDGLYAGDQIVATQVIPLWMTELQTLRAGQSCCKGH